jgi:IMP dehydrogenase
MCWPFIDKEAIMVFQSQVNGNSTLIRLANSKDTGKIGGQLLGIATRRDVDFLKDVAIPIKQVMTPRDKMSVGKKGLSLQEANDILALSKKDTLPIIDTEDRLIALISRSDLRKNRDYPLASKAANTKQLLCAAAIGTHTDDFRRLEELVKVGVDIAVLDSSLGNSIYQIVSTS